MPRQCPDRSTFRAGRNLPDKEFRYLRTVIVTAAVYRGFASDLAALHLTFRHWAGLSPYTSTLRVFAGTGVFGKQSPGPALCDPLALHAYPGCPVQRFTLPGCPFSRSYGANLPSSLAWVLPSTLVCSTSPPVSVCGTVATSLARGFSWQSRINPFGFGQNLLLPLTSRSTTPRICLWRLPTGLEGGRNHPRTYLSASPHRSNGPSRDRNLNLLSIGCGSRLRLRPASPAADQHRCGTLGHSVGRILTFLALLVPTFALRAAPGHLPVPLPG